MARSCIEFSRRTDFDRNMKAFPLLIVLFIVASFCRAQTTLPAASVYDIRSFGAVGDGNTLNTRAIQSAIDKCSEAGGGTVFVTGGGYITGTLYLKSNVNLHID